MRGWTIFAVCLLLLAGCGERRSDYPRRSPPAGLLESSAARTLGQALFARHCAQCHGRIEEGRSLRADFFQPPAPDFREARYRAIDPAYLYWRIAVGKNAEPFRSRGSVMPAWGSALSEEQIWSLVAYLRVHTVR